MKMRIPLIITFCAVAGLQAKEITPVAMPVYEASATKKLEENSIAGSKEGILRVTVAWGYHPKLQVFDERVIAAPSGSTIADVAALWRKEMRTALFAPVYGNVVVLRKNDARVERVTWSAREASANGQKFVLKDGDVLISVGSEVY